jgi:hypothetical protein
VRSVSLRPGIPCYTFEHEVGIAAALKRDLRIQRIKVPMKRRMLEVKERDTTEARC